MAAERFSALQKKILKVLSDEGPIQTQAEIAEQVGSSQSSLSRSIRQLEQDGLVQRTADGYDLTPPRHVSTGPGVSTIIQQTMPHTSRMARNLANLGAIDRKLQYLAQFNGRYAAAMQGANQLADRLNFSLQYSQHAAQAMARHRAMLDRIAPRLIQFNAQLASLQQSMHRIIPQPIITDIDTRVQEWGENLRRANAKLMEYGWFFSPSMPISIVKRVLQEDDVETLIQALVEDHFTTDVCEHILEDICELEVFDRRRPVIEEALRNHRDGRYYTSIPAFLAQADGAYTEVFGSYLIDKKKRNLGTDEDPFGDAMIAAFEQYVREQLAESCGIREDAQEKFGDHVLSRHAVMHGLYVDYGTKENSIKAILLLDFAKFVIESHQRTDQVEASESTAEATSQ